MFWISLLVVWIAPALLLVVALLWDARRSSKRHAADLAARKARGAGNQRTGEAPPR
jgi:hypothetical protein